MEALTLQDLGDLFYMVAQVFGSVVIFGLGFIGGTLR